MSATVAWLLAELPTLGPPLLFVLTTLETCFVTGLVVPSGIATSVATVLGLQGTVDLVPMLVAAFAGGALGDSLGYWVGRWTGDRYLTGEGRFARSLAKRNEQLSSVFGRHPFYSVTVARLISFVRTVMPMMAGMSGLSYRRYLPYQMLGLVGWLAIYVGIGFGARESWEVATQIVGVGGVVIFGAASLAVWIAYRRKGQAPQGTG